MVWGWNIYCLLFMLIPTAVFGAGQPAIQGAYFIPRTFLDPVGPEALRVLAVRVGIPVRIPDSRALYSTLMTPSAPEGSATAPKADHYGTYLIELDGGEAGKKGIAFNINESFRMFLVRGDQIDLLYEDGTPSPDPDANMYRLVPYATHEAYFQLEHGTAWLVIHASAPIHREKERVYSSLGLVSLKIDEAKNIRLRKVSNELYQTTCFGAFFLVFTYQIAIFLLRRNDLSNLMIALAGFAFLMRCLAEEQVLALYFDQSNTLSAVNSGIQFLRFIFLNCASFFVTYFLIREVFTKTHIRIMGGSAIITTLIISLIHLNPLVPGYVKDRALAFLTATILASALLSAGLFFKAWKQKIPGALFGVFGFSLGPILVGLDAMIILGKIDMFRVGTLGLVLMAFASSLISGKQFAEAYRRAGLLNDELSGKNREIQDMNHNLEVKVENRTRELKTIFDNIPQGVASLDGHGIISPNYSRHLESILNQKNIGGRSILEFFSRTTLSQDATDRMMATIMASVGEQLLNFELNCSNLPREVTVERESGTAFYALIWGPELADDGIVHSLLMTVEDVTGTKRLEVESAQQRKDLLVIQELLHCEADKFDIFARASEALLAENMRLIQAGALSEEDVKIMFINAHTVKGGARTLGLSGLANVLHETEHAYAQIMKGLLKAQQEPLESSIHQAWSVFNLYIGINRNKLGRKSEIHTIAIDIEFIKTHYRAMEFLMLENPTTPKSLLDYIRKTRDELASFIFKSDTHILEQCFESAAKIAQDLGKPAPLIKLHTEEIQVPRETEQVLRNALIHILRNALDHGIESVDERQRAKKSETGVIEIRSRKSEGAIVIDIHDDGRGLAIKKLKEKGIRNGYISELADTQAIADIIFMPGLTTTQSLSQISGRGVGMDAARRFIQGGGGSIQVRLLPGEGDYVPFVLSITLPLNVA